MSTLAERLRVVLTPAARGHEEQVQATRLPGSLSAPERDSVAETLGGEWCTAYNQRFLIVDRFYAGSHRHGRVSVLDAVPPDTGVWPRLALLADGSATWSTSTGERPRRLVFLDLETTGLAGGAGTYAFLVGCAWFEGGTFQVRQFFLSSFAAERAILQAVTDLVGDAAALVTFNGKTFDVPLIDTRFSLQRLASPFGALPHVDMLHVARRFWRRSEDSTTGDADADASKSRGCRLSELEYSVCGHERHGDVPGFEIPARYFHFVHSGDARGLEAVLEHNRLDLISLAILTARAAQMLDEGPSAAETAREALGLGTIYERAGFADEARAAYGHAAGLSELGDGRSVSRGGLESDPTTCAEALRAYALLARRERRYEDAARAWRGVLELGRCPSQIAREAAEALAVHHEHRLRDLDVARRFALQSLQYRSSPTRTQAVRHRLDRLDRKLGRSPGGEALF